MDTRGLGTGKNIRERKNMQNLNPLSIAKAKSGDKAQ